MYEYHTQQTHRLASMMTNFFYYAYAQSIYACAPFRAFVSPCGLLLFIYLHLPLLPSPSVSFLVGDMHAVSPTSCCVRFCLFTFGQLCCAFSNHKISSFRPATNVYVYAQFRRRRRRWNTIAQTTRDNIFKWIGFAISHHYFGLHLICVEKSMEPVDTCNSSGCSIEE